MSVKKLKKAELADLFGESPKQIERYVKEGIPHEGTGRTLVFPWPEVRNWRDDRLRRLERERLERDKPLDIDEARRRKMEAEAREAEIRVDQALGNLVPAGLVDEVAGAIGDRMLPVLQNLPANYTLRLEEVGVPADTAERVLEAIATELTKALQSTSDAVETLGDVDASDDDESSDGVRIA